jgi:hypothetical protein
LDLGGRLPEIVTPVQRTESSRLAQLQFAMVGAVFFAIDFNDGSVIIAAFMRAPLCVVNERRQQMAGLGQAHPRVRPEGAVFQCLSLPV